MKITFGNTIKHEELHQGQCFKQANDAENFYIMVEDGNSINLQTGTINTFERDSLSLLLDAEILVR